MTEFATIDWFGRWGTSVFSENTAIFLVNILNTKRNTTNLKCNLFLDSDGILQ